MKPLTEEELGYLETCDLVNNEAAKRLVAEIRRFREEAICPKHAGVIEKFMEATKLVSKLFDRVQALDKFVAAVRYRHELGVCYATLRKQGAKLPEIYEAQRLLMLAQRKEIELLQALDAKPQCTHGGKPIPMCKPDPLEGIMPDEGSRP